MSNNQKVRQIREDMLAYDESDLQSLQGFADEGMTIHDWIECKKDMIKWAKERLENE